MMHNSMQPVPVTLLDKIC